MSQGLIFSCSPLSHLIKPETTFNTLCYIHVICILDKNGMGRWADMKTMLPGMAIVRTKAGKKRVSLDVSYDRR